MKCSACDHEQGELHSDTCDMEPCAKCKTQLMSCGCTDHPVRVPVGWNPVHDSDLWFEYLDTINGFPNCGLCGGYGILTTKSGRKDPCICPNGRTIKQMRDV